MIKHIEHIERLVKNWKDDCVLVKVNGRWEKQECTSEFPVFRNEKEYQVVAKRHADLALEYFNDNIEIEISTTMGADTVTTKSVMDPTFISNLDYREKGSLVFPRVMKNGSTIALVQDKHTAVFLAVKGIPDHIIGQSFTIADINDWNDFEIIY